MIYTKNNILEKIDFLLCEDAWWSIGNKNLFTKKVIHSLKFREFLKTKMPKDKNGFWLYAVQNKELSAKDDYICSLNISNIHTDPLKKKLLKKFKYRDDADDYFMSLDYPERLLDFDFNLANILNNLGYYITDAALENSQIYLKASIKLTTLKYAKPQMKSWVEEKSNEIYKFIFPDFKKYLESNNIKIIKTLKPFSEFVLLIPTTDEEIEDLLKNN